MWEIHSMFVEEILNDIPRYSILLPKSPIICEQPFDNPYLLLIKKLNTKTTKK